MQFLAWTYWILSLIYLGCTLIPPFQGDFIPKVLPILCLLLWCQKLLAERVRLLMTAALAFSATGDVALNLNLFIPRLAAFLVAQLTYAVLFLPEFRWRSDRRWGYLLFAIYFLTLGAILLPNLGDMTPAVLAYMAAIAWMALNALSHRSNEIWIPLGALVFVLSDSLIATHRFLVEFPLAKPMIMLTYYFAQWCIFIGMVKAHSTINSDSVVGRRTES